MKQAVLLSTLLLLQSCDDVHIPTAPGPHVPSRPGGEPETWDNPVPELHVVSPDRLSVGQEVTILGNNFVPARHGAVTLRFVGNFFDEAGQSYPVDRQVRPKWINKTKLSWKLWPDVVFHPSGDQLGTFIGEVSVTNALKDGTQQVSPARSTKITIGPSLLPRYVQPAEGGCNSLVSSTLEGVGFAFAVEAIGFRPATKDEPLTFRWTFQFGQWDVSFRRYDFFDPEWFSPDSVLPKEGAIMLEEEVTEGASSVMSEQRDRHWLVKAGSDALKLGSSLLGMGDAMGSASVKSLKTEEIPEDGNNFIANVNVAVTDAAGKTANLAIPITVHRVADLHYDSNQQIAERFEPVRVSDCIPGGDIGRNATYREDKSESRSRSMTFQYNANLGVNLGLPSNPFALGLNFSAGFGVDVNATISTSRSKSLDLSGQILPGIYGMFYRQTTKVYRVGKLFGRDKCGLEVDLGEAILTDWVFTPELATSSACPPPSALPRAQKFQ